MDLVPSCQPGALAPEPGERGRDRLLSCCWSTSCAAVGGGASDRSTTRATTTPIATARTRPRQARRRVPGDGGGRERAAAMQISGTADRQPLTGRGGPAALPLTRRHRPGPARVARRARRVGLPAVPAGLPRGRGRGDCRPARPAPAAPRPAARAAADGWRSAPRRTARSAVPRRRPDQAGAGRPASSSSGVSAAALAAPGPCQAPLHGHVAGDDGGPGVVELAQRRLAGLDRLAQVDSSSPPRARCQGRPSPAAEAEPEPAAHQQHRDSRPGRPGPARPEGSPRCSGTALWPAVRGCSWPARGGVTCSLAGRGGSVGTCRRRARTAAGSPPARRRRAQSSILRSWAASSASRGARRAADVQRDEQAGQHRLQHHANGQAVMPERAVQRRRRARWPGARPRRRPAGGGQRRAGPARDVGSPSAVPRALRHAVQSSGIVPGTVTRHLPQNTTH